MKWLNKSIVTRLTTWYAVSAFIMIFVATSFLYYSLFKILKTEDIVFLKDRAEAINNLLATNEQPLSALKQRVELEWATRRFEHVYVRIINASGTTLVATPDVPKGVETSVFTVLENETVAFSSPRRMKGADGNTYLVMGTILNSEHAGLSNARLLMVLDLSLEDEILTRYKNIFALVLLLGLFVSTFLGHKLAKLSFAPVQDIIDKTRKIRSSSLFERIEENKLPRELATMAQTVNEMLDRLEDSFGRLSRFSSDIAHELRTPINNIQGEIQVTLNQTRSLAEYRELVLSVNEEIGRISKLIDNLLFLAKSENPALQLKKEKFNLKREVINIFDFYEASASEDQIKIDLDIPEHIEVWAEKTLFQRVLSNVLSNSINYTDKGGNIKVMGKRSQRGIDVIVRDSGRGIPSGDLPKIFERFYRVDPSRTASKLGGFGLGLTIVQSIMVLHRGTVKVDSEVGHGTEVTLHFPYS